MKVVFSVFDKQHFMTVVDVSISNFHSMDSLACLNGGFFRPVDVFSSFENINFGTKIDTSSVSSYPTTRGYFVRSNFDGIVKELYGKISNYNPRTKLMVNVVNGDMEEARQVLKIGFERFKMLDLVSMIYLPLFEDGALLSVNLIACLYNPFSATSKFRSFTFTSFNVDENLREMGNFETSRMNDLQGFPLKVSIFEHEMKSVAVYDELGRIKSYTYPDGELIESIAKCMNFTPVYKTILTKPKFGYQLPNGSYTGSLAETEYERVDIAANPKLISNYNTTKSVFLQPVAMTKLFFIVKRRSTSKIIVVSLFSELDNMSTVIAVALTVAFPIVYLVVHNIEHDVMSNHVQRFYKKGKRVNIVQSVTYTAGLQNCISMKHSTMSATRMIVAMILFYTLMFTSLFQGSIIKHLNSNRDQGKIKKIDNLLEQNFSIAMQAVLTYAFQEPGDSKISKELYKLTRNIEQSGVVSEVAIERLKRDYKFAYLWLDLMSGNYLNNFYDSKTGENLLEAVPESAFEFYIAMMAPKTSPFIDRFNQIINIYVQTGLYGYNTKRSYDDNEKVLIYRVKNGLTPKEKSQSLSLHDLQDAFKVYFSLLGCGCFAFILEAYIKFLTTK